MSQRNWLQELGWSEEHLDEIRNIAYSYIRQGKYDIALPFFEALAAINCNSAYDLQLLGAIYVQTNRPRLAISCLNKALQYSGDHSPTLLNLMKAFFMSKRIEDGLRLAHILEKDIDIFVASSAKALILCYEKR